MDRNQLTALAVEVVTAHVTNNKVPAEELPLLLRNIYDALADFVTLSPDAGPHRVPAVAVEDSIHPDRLTCLVCGNEHRTLTRHLRTAHHMSPEEYRANFRLRGDYPMNAESYSALRGHLAKTAGLGSGKHSRHPKRRSADVNPI
jgi:predicted transcriptional regulator